MNKRFLLIMFFLAAGLSAFAERNLNFIVDLMFGGNFFGRTDDDFAINFNANTKPGMSIAGDILYPVQSFLEVGAGLEWQFNRALKADSNEKFNFFPLYGILRIHWRTNYVSLYGVGRVGYNFLFGSSSYKNGGKLNGGLFWSLGAGLLIRDIMFLETHYSMNMGSIKISGSTAKIFYSHWDVYFGVKIKIDFSGRDRDTYENEEAEEEPGGTDDDDTENETTQPDEPEEDYPYY